MALDFPNAPAVNDVYALNGKNWQWNGRGWQLIGTFALGTFLSAIQAAGLSVTNSRYIFINGSGAFVLVDGPAVLSQIGAAADSAVVKKAATSTVTVGYNATENDNGTKSSGTLTPDPALGNFQKVVNGGAHTLAAPTASGSYSIVLDVTNNGSAGVITVTGFTKQTGDAFDTTNAHAFRCFITVGAGGKHLHVQAMF